MDIKPIEMAEFNLVVVKTTNTCNPTPHCKNHGAMNKMNTLEDGGGYWRCITVSGYRKSKEGNSISLKSIENICRAGCCETRN